MTTQTENKIRVRKAAGWILQGHSVSHVVARLAESEGVSRRTARRIAGKAMDLVHKDLEATNLETPQTATVLLHNLQESAWPEGWTRTTLVPLLPLLVS